MSRFSRLSLLWKILLSTSVAVTLLFAIIGRIVLSNINSTMSASLDEETRAGLQAYTALWNARGERLASVSRLLSTMSDVRAAFGTRDQATIRDTAGELWSNVSGGDAIFVVTDARGGVIASLGEPNPLSMQHDMPAVRTAAPKFPRQVSGFLFDGGELYQLYITPVYVESTGGPVLFNVLVAGYRVDALVAQQLKESTGGSEFLFLTPGRVVASTLNPRATAAVVRGLAARAMGDRLSDGVVEYARLATPLPGIGGAPVGSLLILRSFESVNRRISSLYTNIALLWLGAVCAGLAFTYLLARRIVQPVKQLDCAAAEVARRNYSIEVPVRSEDELGRLARTFNDMCASIRQAREDLIRQERISTIGRLSGSIVHDLRNPLAAIYGGAEMLVDSDLPPGHVKRLAGNIYRSSRRIQELLQDLVNVSRGKTELPELCRLHEVAAAACERAAHAAETQSVEIRLSIPAEIELPLERSRMERLFANLVSNAIEAMPDGGRVEISAELENGDARITVADTGPGIAPEIRASLFQPFVTSGKRNGLGLGLALSRQTVLDHGGDMWVESERGRGASFIVRLPHARAAAAKGVRV
jgi:signal transduction histidine kinase